MIYKKIFKGNVYHKRFSPKIHSFKYKAFFLKFSLKDLKSLENNFFSIDRFNVFSFYQKDHGYRDGSNLFKFAEDILLQHSIQIKIDDIIIQTLPRVFGFVFNPVSFWYLYDQYGNEIARLAEVNNTFGETKTYLINSSQSSTLKTMQVSPYNLIEGEYQFTFRKKDTYEFVSINYFKNNSILLTAYLKGIEIKWSSVNFLKILFQFPFNTFIIVLRIHYQALRLFIKGIPFHGKNGVIHDRVN